MSFKREGNDASLLGKLRNRRITELLSEDIPEDEAKLLCNGRFTCTVCPGNTIFDTVNMLTVHRNGKKHASNQQVFNAKKRELNHLIAARKHQQYLKDGSTSIRMAKPNDRSLLTSCPYDPRVKKAKVKIGERKPILDLGKTSEMLGLDSVKIHNMGKPAVDARNITYGSSSTISDPFERCLTGPFKHTHQLTDIFKEKAKDPVRIAPYKSKFRSNLSFHKNIQSRCTKESTLTGSQGPENCPSVSSLPSLYGRVPSIFSMEVSPRNASFTTNETHLTVKPTSLQHSHISNKFIPPGPGTQAHKLLLSFPPPPPPPPPPPVNRPEDCTSSVSNSPFTSDKTVVNAERLKEQNMLSQKLRQLQGSGWKRDWDGKWIKDKDAEFDSDDEPPDFL